MSNENENKNVDAAFENSIDSVKKLRGGVRAFVLVALSADEDEQNNLSAVCAMAGSGSDIIGLVSKAGEDLIARIVK